MYGVRKMSKLVIRKNGEIVPPSAVIGWILSTLINLGATYAFLNVLAPILHVESITVLQATSVHFLVYNLRQGIFSVDT